MSPEHDHLSTENQPEVPVDKRREIVERIAEIAFPSQPGENLSRRLFLEVYLETKDKGFTDIGTLVENLAIRSDTVKDFLATEEERIPGIIVKDVVRRKSKFRFNLDYIDQILQGKQSLPVVNSSINHEYQIAEEIISRKPRRKRRITKKEISDLQFPDGKRFTAHTSIDRKNFELLVQTCDTDVCVRKDQLVDPKNPQRLDYELCSFRKRLESTEWSLENIQGKTGQDAIYCLIRKVSALKGRFAYQSTKDIGREFGMKNDEIIPFLAPWVRSNHNRIREFMVVIRKNNWRVAYGIETQRAEELKSFIKETLKERRAKNDAKEPRARQRRSKEKFVFEPDKKVVKRTPFLEQERIRKLVDLQRNVAMIILSHYALGRENSLDRDALHLLIRCLSGYDSPKNIAKPAQELYDIANISNSDEYAEFLISSCACYLENYWNSPKPQGERDVKIFNFLQTLKKRVETTQEGAKIKTILSQIANHFETELPSKYEEIPYDVGVFLAAPTPIITKDDTSGSIMEQEFVIPRASEGIRIE